MSKGQGTGAHPADRAATASDVEEWRPVPDYDGLYEVSNFGRVRSMYWSPPRLLALTTDQSGYLVVQMNRKGRRRPYTVHRLVCRAFHGSGDPLHNEAGHLDGNRRNARADNLKWVSKVENHSHKRLHGTHQAGDKGWAPKAQPPASDRNIVT